MGKITVMVGAVLSLILLAPGSGKAFRCGSGLVVAGDRTGKVLMECGPPTARESEGTKKVSSSGEPRGKATRRTPQSGSRQGTVRKIERWFYNCGEHDLVYVLTFEEGVLTQEETHGFGHGRSDCQGRR